MLNDPRFENRASRLAHRAELTGLVEEMVKQYPTAWWVEKLADAGVPCMRINTLPEVVGDPHLADVDFWHEVDHPSEGRIRMIKPPYTLSKTPAAVRTLPPRFGEHTAQVLAGLGYSEAEIAAMLKAGAAMARPQ